MAKILVIDPGTYMVKTVLLTRDWNTVKILDYRRYQLVPDLENTDEPVKKIIGELVKNTDQRVDDVYMVIPANNLFFRNLQFVFPQRRKIEKVLPFQLESLLPLKKENIIADFILTGRRDNDEHEVFSAVCKKSVLESYVGLLKSRDLALSGMRIGAVAMANLVAQFGKDVPAESMIIDIGEKTTKIIILESGTLRYVRVIFWGGDTITRVFQDVLHMEYDEAEHTKQNVESVTLNTDAPMDEIIARGCREGLVEVKETLDYYREKMNGKPVHAIYLCGGGAMTSGITELFERSLNTPCSLLAENLNGALIAGMNRDEVSVFAPALSAGYSVLKSQRKKTMELLRGEFQPAGGLRTYRTQFMVTLILMFVLFVLYIYSLQVTIHVKEKQVNDLKQFMDTILTRNFPSETKIVNPLIQMQGLVQEEQGMHHNNPQDSAQSRLFPANILRLIHQTAPQDSNLVITELQIDQNRVFMVGETSTFDSIIKIKSALESLPYFGESVVTSEKLQSKSSTIRFTLKIPLGEPQE